MLVLFGTGIVCVLVMIAGRQHRAHPPRPGAPRGADRPGRPAASGLVFGLSQTTASKYTLIACDLLAGQATSADQEQRDASPPL
jgi:hypothetical protein